ncbi:MAG: VWA domain-containing protein, partial [Muribaculaceae bacterium]|nr:VWA domain-containing protein [Muribaculaceae bacterium]
MNLVHPIYLYLLLAIPVLLVLFMLARFSRRRKLQRFGRLHIIEHLMPEASKYKPWIKIITQLIAVACLVLIIVRPQYGEQENKKYVPRGIEVMFAVDLSKSMLASSTSDHNGVSRLDRTKMVMDKIIDRMSGNKIGMVVFAGDAHLKMTLTTDFWMLRDFINDLSTDDIPYQGTDIGQALSLCAEQFTPDDPDHKKAIILLTDAEDLMGDAMQAAESLSNEDIQINVIGLGSDPGSQIPINYEKNQFLIDPTTGKIVTTAIDAEMAANLAKAGKGVYVDGNSSEAV